jgi:hypothetical protein
VTVFKVLNLLVIQLGGSVDAIMFPVLIDVGVSNNFCPASKTNDRI